MPCANCRQDLRVGEAEVLEEDKKESLDQLTSITKTEDDVIDISEAIKTVFEGVLRLKKKQIPSTTSSRIKMCTECVERLATLHRSYKKFMHLTREASYMHQLIETSVLWHFQKSSRSTFGDDDDYSSYVEVKMEVEEQETIKEENEDKNDPDFECDYTENNEFEVVDEEFPFVRSTRRTTARRFALRLRGMRAAAIQNTQPKVKGRKRSKRAVLKSTPKKERMVKPKLEIQKSESFEKPFKCSVEGCTKSFTCAKLFRRHKKFKHGGATPEELERLTCNQCVKPKIFSTPSQLKNHADAVHATEMPFDCPKCERKFPTKNRLTIHTLVKHSMKTQAQKEKILFPCPHECSIEPFRSKVSLKLHLKSVHNEDIIYTCPICDKKFQRSTRYRRHLKYKHGEGLTDNDLQGRECGHCSKVFETPSQLRYHTEAVHAAEKPFQCEECGKKFPTKNYLSIHTLLRHKRQSVRYPCERCQKSYSSKPSLLDHIDSVHLKKKDIVCEICGRKFSRQSGLNRHMETHDATRKRTWQCEICSQYFISDKTLKSHAKTHSGVKDQLCTQCGDTFLHVASLRRHLHAKHGIINSSGVDSGGGHTCEQCGKTFKLKEYLRQHLRSRTHGGKGHTLQKKREAATRPHDRDPDDSDKSSVTSFRVGKSGRKAKATHHTPPSATTKLDMAINSISALHEHATPLWPPRPHPTMFPGTHYI